MNRYKSQIEASENRQDVVATVVMAVVLFGVMVLVFCW